MHKIYSDEKEIGLLIKLLKTIKSKRMDSKNLH